MAVEQGRKERFSRLTMQAIRLAGRDLSVRGDAGDLELSGGLWRTMARGGLLGWSIPAAFGGEGAGFSDILPAVEAFVAKGGRPGIALSWMVHLIVGRVLIAGFGNGRQKKEVLPGMASGKRTVSIALSEPGAGSDPKRIRTTAVKRGRFLFARWGKGLAHQWSPGRSLHCICRDGRAGREKGLYGFSRPEGNPRAHRS